MPEKDILLEGLARDAALRDANRASQPSGPLTAIMGVDDSAQALRALRSAGKGSLYMAAGEDWFDRYKEPQLLYENPVFPGAIFFPAIDTPPSGFIAFEIQLTAVMPLGVPPNFRVSAAPGFAPNALIFASPIIADGTRLEYVVACHGFALVAWLQSNAPAPGGYVKITWRFIAPGAPLPAVQAHMIELVNAHVPVGATFLTAYKNVLAPLVRLHFDIDGAPVNPGYCYIQAYPHAYIAYSAWRQLIGTRLAVNRQCITHNTAGGSLYDVIVAGAAADYHPRIALEVLPHE